MPFSRDFPNAVFCFLLPFGPLSCLRIIQGEWTNCTKISIPLTYLSLKRILIVSVMPFKYRHGSVSSSYFSLKSKQQYWGAKLTFSLQKFRLTYNVLKPEMCSVMPLVDNGPCGSPPTWDISWIVNLPSLRTMHWTWVYHQTLSTALMKVANEYRQNPGG